MKLTLTTDEGEVLDIYKLNEYLIIKDGKFTPMSARSLMLDIEQEVQRAIKFDKVKL